MSTQNSIQERSRVEATRDVVFLLQRARLEFITEPTDYVLDEAGECFVHIEDGHEISFATAFSLHLEDETGSPAVIKDWVVESVWATREAAERHAVSRLYNYPHGWQVYGIPAGSDLAALIKQAESN